MHCAVPFNTQGSEDLRLCYKTLLQMTNIGLDGMSGVCFYPYQLTSWFRQQSTKHYSNKAICCATGPTATILKLREQHVCLQLAATCRPCQLTINISAAMSFESGSYKVWSGGICQSNPQPVSFPVHSHLLVG